MSVPSTNEEWTALRELVKQSALLKRGPSETIELRICAALTFLSGLLYAASFLKRRSEGLWLLKKDSEGYYHPNVHTTLPVFAVLYAILDVSAVLFIEKNLNHVVDPLPVTLQLLAYEALQAFAWVKIWAILYALLSSRLRRQTSGNSCRTRKLISPRTFNTFVLTTITVVLLGQIPLITLLSMSIQKFRNQFSYSDLSIQQAAAASTLNADNPLFIDGAAIQALLNLAILNDEGARATSLFQTYIIFTISWMSFNILVFSISAAFLLHALRSQKSVLSSALENRKMLKLIQESEQGQNEPREISNRWDLRSEDGWKSTKSHKSFDPRTWKSWIDFANDESTNGDAFWGRLNKLNQPVRFSRANLADALVVGEKSTQKQYSNINDAALEMHCATTTRYWYSTMGQTIVGLGMFSSYLVMGCWLLLTSAHSSGNEQLIEAFIWSNWIWGGGPGLVLGIVACTVAFSPTPILPQSSKLPTIAAPTGDSNVASSSGHQGKPGHGKGGGFRNLTRESQDTTASGFKEADHEKFLLPSAAWSRPSTDSGMNIPVLARQASFSSSTFSFATANQEPTSQGTSLEMSCGKRYRLHPDDAVETEWVGGHLKAIQGLRECH